MNSKKLISSIIVCFVVTALCFAQKTEFYVRTGSSGFIEHNITHDDSSFGGMYSTYYGCVNSKNTVVVAKSKIKLGSCDKIEDLSTSSTWEKAWIGVDIPVFSALRLYGGKGFVLNAPGTFFNMTEEYADGSRWGKDGIGFTVKNEFASWGASFYSSDSSYKLKEKLRIGTGLNLDFNQYGIPLTAGVSVIYNNGKNYSTQKVEKLSSSSYKTEDGDKEKIYETSTVYDYGRLFRDERDYTAAFFAQYKLDRSSSVALGYTINGSPVAASSTFKRVENYKTAELANSHLLTLISAFKLGIAKFEAEAEAGKTFDGDYYSVYGGLRAKAKLAGIFHLYPQIQYFAVSNSENSDLNRDSLILYPRFTLEKGPHYFFFGFQFEHRQMKTDSYDWIFKFPMYYKISL